MIMADPGHQYHRAMKRWCGGRFDPNRFSQSSASEDVCKVLKGKRRSRRRQAPRPGKVS
jgi:hypothetical protein